MQEPSVRTSRLAIAAGFAAIIAIGGSGFFLGRVTAPAPKAPAPVAPAPTPAPKPVVKTLERGDLLALAQQAADAFASGQSAPKAVTDAAGRAFDLTLPFGCGGPADADSGVPMRWSYDEDEQILRISVRSETWKGGDWGSSGPADAEVAEGFWISRPWMSSPDCPLRGDRAMARGVEPVTLPGQTLAIAQFAGNEADRDLHRGGRPYEIVQRVPKERFDGSRGFRLLVSGRIANPGASAPIRCVQPAGTEQRPICAIDVRIESVRIANPVSGETLATWSTGRVGQ